MYMLAYFVYVALCLNVANNHLLLTMGFLVKHKLHRIIRFLWFIDRCSCNIECHIDTHPVRISKPFYLSAEALIEKLH